MRFLRALDTLRINGVSLYQLSKESGVPKTTVIDICSGKTSMEEIIELDNSEYNPGTGMPVDDAHYEFGLPKDLQISIDNMKKS